MSSVAHLDYVQRAQGNARRTLNELILLAASRRQRGHRMDPMRWAFALAAALTLAPPSETWFRKNLTVQKGPNKGASKDLWLKSSWDGLTLETLDVAIKATDLGAFSKAELEAVIAAIDQIRGARSYIYVSGVKFGRYVQLTTEERDNLELRTLFPIDESQEEREARQVRNRRTSNVRAQRKRREGKHTPRHERSRIAAAKKDFCRDHHICSRTLRRWIAEGKIDVHFVSAYKLRSNCEVTPSGHLETPAVAGPASTTVAVATVGAGEASPLGHSREESLSAALAHVDAGAGGTAPAAAAQEKQRSEKETTPNAAPEPVDTRRRLAG